MSSNHNADELLQALALMLAKLEQRETQLHTSLEHKAQSAHRELQQLQLRLAGMVGNAQAAIAEQASVAMIPIARECVRRTTEVTTQLRRTSSIIWGWYIGLVGLGLLLGLLLWAVLGYYQRELEAARQELARHDNALPVLQAFQASDASVCDGHLCIRADGTAPRYGQERQYIRAAAR
ncbi:hypothetical protein [Stenotrophomonas koreensis]|uniref:hypothetical protein n=1 Tax=Stenotrophomonas koreensis TaxID=266128 RepID=UPI00070C923B|nr:hypothetical protein [Stenotrophomonas koreensis]